MVLVEIVAGRGFRPRSYPADRHHPVLFRQIDQRGRDARKPRELAFQHIGGDACRNPGVDGVATRLQYLNRRQGRPVMARGRDMPGRHKFRSRYGFRQRICKLTGHVVFPHICLNFGFLGPKAYAFPRQSTRQSDGCSIGAPTGGAGQRAVIAKLDCIHTAADMG